MSEAATVKPSKAKRRWTGFHTLAALVAFFGVIFAVNGIMTYIALSTFSGIETQNAYQTGRDYNERLEAAAAQRALGWQVSFEETFAATPEGADATVAVQVRDANGTAMTGLGGDLTFWRPVVRGEDMVAPLIETAPGIYNAQASLPARGHWEMRLLLEREDAAPYYLEKRIWAGGRDSDG
ncbi:MAG: FixH family protein [Pseudomonadota bacterium]